MKKIIIETPKAPAPIGPYSQAIKIGNTLYCSGQIALDAETGDMQQADIFKETAKVMENIEAVLEAADMDFSNIVKTTIFLSDMELFPKVNEVYGQYFKETYPARETVAVKGLPKGAHVEISVIAVD